MSDAVGRLLQNVVNLERIANSLTAESQARVQELFRQIAEDLARIDITGVSASSYQAARLDKFLALLKERLKDYQGAEATALKDRLAVIGRYQAKQVEGSLVATITEVGGRTVAFTPITQSRVRTILNTDPFQGRLLSEHVERIGANAAVKVRDQVRMGMVRQESVSDLVRRVRGKMVGYRVVDGAKRPNFEGGVIDTTTREAEALVRTAVTYVSNAGAQATFEENQKYLSGVEFTATLDDRTTLLCASLDGTVWPVGSTDIIVPGRDTHWNCRSILVPVVDWSALGLEPPPEPPRVARNLKGVSEDDLNRRVSARRRTGDLGTVEKVSSATKAEDWLRRQPQRVQDKMLGKGRAALWRDGKYTLADLIKRDNTTVPLHELLSAN